MPRPPNIIPSTRWSISLPEDLAAEIELVLADPLTNKVTYATRSKLLETLLRQWLESKKTEMRNALASI